jgi:hypothetical protein
VDDLVEFLAILRHVNSRAKVILTVSPVPLIATASGKHVLVATTYSKSVLRVACEEITAKEKKCCKFSSYEIITGSFNRGRYFAKDLRSVTEAGVNHVMRVFLKHFTMHEAVSSASGEVDHLEHELADVARVVCDQEMFDRHV